MLIQFMALWHSASSKASLRERLHEHAQVFQHNYIYLPLLVLLSRRTVIACATRAGNLFKPTRAEIDNVTVEYGQLLHRLVKPTTSFSICAKHA